MEFEAPVREVGPVTEYILAKKKIECERIDSANYRIGVDVDMTLANLHKKWITYYNTIFDDNLTEHDIKGWKMTDYVKEEAKPFILNILSIHKFYRDLEVIADSQRVLENLYNYGHEIFIVTDPFTRMSYKSKYDWIKENFPFVPERNIIFTGNKSSVGLDFLIDDGAHNLETFQGVPILFNAPHNQNIDKFYRVKNWQDVEHLFEYDRIKDVIKFYEEQKRRKGVTF